MSFARALQAHYGARYVADYFDLDHINNVYMYEKRMPAKFDRASVSTDTKIIHGHMLLCKWVAQFSPHNHPYVTWLRHPVKRLASHFQFMHDKKNTASPNDRVWEVIHDNWSFEQFCFSPVYQDYMFRYLGGLPISLFQFVGICEHFDADIKYFFNTYCDSDPEVFDTNKTKTKLTEVEQCMNDTSFVNAVLGYHSKDATIYNQSLERRQKERG